MGKLFKRRVRVKFVDAMTGMEEAGIDSGGPFKEFLEATIKEVFRPEYGMFSATGTDTSTGGGGAGGGGADQDEDGNERKDGGVTEAKMPWLEHYPSSSSAGGSSNGNASSSVTEAAFYSALGQCYYPNLSARFHPETAEFMSFVGRIVAKALYEGVLLHVPLAPFFLARIVGQSAALGDLQLMVTLASEQNNT